MSEPKPCILVADDEMDTRKIQFESLTYWGAEVLVAADGEEALRLVAGRPIDIAIVDVVMPAPAGLELADCLQRIDPDVRVIIATAYGTIPHAVRAVKDGIFEYLSKPIAPSEVRKVVERAWQDYIDSTCIKVGDVTIDWRKHQMITERGCQPLDSLTCRERQVLDLVAEGYSDLAIAQRLGIRKSTTKTHVRNILSKLRIQNRTQLAVLWDRYKKRHPY